MRLVKRENAQKEEKRYFVPEIARAIGLSEGTIRGYFRNGNRGRQPKSTKEGLTIEEIEEVLNRDRTRGDGLDFTMVEEIKKRLAERGWVVEDDDE